MPALEGQFLKEISVRFAGKNHVRTQKNTKQSSAQRFLNDPFPKDRFFQLLILPNCIDHECSAEVKAEKCLFSCSKENDSEVLWKEKT